MSMTLEQMRAEVARLYSGYAWKDKVARMPERQILAIYQRQVLGRASAGGGAGNDR